MPEASPSKEKTAYEHRDAPIALLVGIMGLVAAVTISAVLILSGLYPGTTNQPSPAPGRLPPQPRLEINEAHALRQFNAHALKRLESYGWVDRRRGIVHIPIGLAMRRAAKYGFPDWPGNPGAKPAAAASATAPPQAPGPAGNAGNTGAAPGNTKAAGR